MNKTWEQLAKDYTTMKFRHDIAERLLRDGEVVVAMSFFGEKMYDKGSEDERTLCAKDVCIGCRSPKLFHPAAYSYRAWRHVVIGAEPENSIRCQAEEIWTRANR